MDSSDKPLTKSAKYKRQERVTKKLFYVVSFVCVLNALSVLIFSILRHEEEDLIENLITV